MESNNLLHNIEGIPKDKKLIVFDLDSTLIESKSYMDPEMAALLGKLLEVKKVAVIGGGKYSIFQDLFISRLSAPSETLKKLLLFPATATKFYRHNGSDWELVYSDEFTPEEKEKIFAAFKQTFSDLNYNHPEKVYGELIEDRGAEITFSVFGQDAPLELKEKWNKENPELRPKMEAVLQKYLPDMEIKVAGLTSVDVTRKGIDKEYGIYQIQKYLNISLEDMFFIGDAFGEEQNDAPVLRTGIPCFEVRSIDDTKALIGNLIKEGPSLLNFSHGFG